MKKSIIEVTLPTENVPQVKPALVQCLNETHDLLIGHRVFDDLTLFVVQLKTVDNGMTHASVLAPAFQQRLIISFQFLTCYLFKFTFRSRDFQNSMHRFPLREGEAMFPAANEENVAYFCLRSPNLGLQQHSWITEEKNNLEHWEEVL